MLSNGLVLIVFLSGKHTATSEHISTSVEAKQQHNEKERNNKCTCFMTLRISSSQTCKCQSLKRAGVKATLHQSANGGTSLCAKCIKSYHRFWLPGSHARSRSLLQMFTEPMPQLYFQSGAFSSSSSSSSLPGSIRGQCRSCLLYTSPRPRDRTRSRMPSSA
mgnify:CR=1 FL=1